MSAKPKKKPASRAKRPRAITFDQRVDALGEAVIYASELPGMVSDIVGLCTAHRLTGCIKVYFTVEPGFPDTVGIGRCPRGHVHVIYNAQVTLAVMNISSLIAWSIALCCDRNKTWDEHPTVEGVIAAMGEIIADPAIDEIRSFVENVYQGADPLVRSLLEHEEDEEERPTYH